MLTKQKNGYLNNTTQHSPLRGYPASTTCSGRVGIPRRPCIGGGRSHTLRSGPRPSGAFSGSLRGFRFYPFRPRVSSLPPATTPLASLWGAHLHGAHAVRRTLALAVSARECRGRQPLGRHCLNLVYHCEPNLKTSTFSWLMGRAKDFHVID
jgi:hypothetical protein